ncbi:hypothetical protein SAMD00023353_1401270 [Rosellinia necatrix]|uniref:Uncharacterized protein n=1 Tax=Rosellinia necatrix TaxID=77044 RepID=A0A1W2TCX2_ROSNE|nr:hypothetical protein SAMD00023353_1401270 [Rosellinia necatrix]
MRVSAVLFAVGAAAATTSVADLGSWKIMSIATGCKFGRCFTSYVVSGDEVTVDGVTFPSFAARCKTLGSCTNALEGSSISSKAEDGKLTVTQTAGGKTLTAIADWDETTETYVEAPIISVS